MTQRVSNAEMFPLNDVIMGCRCDFKPWLMFCSNHCIAVCNMMLYPIIRKPDRIYAQYMSQYIFVPQRRKKNNSALGHGVIINGLNVTSRNKTGPLWMCIFRRYWRWRRSIFGWKGTEFTFSFDFSSGNRNPHVYWRIYHGNTQSTDNISTIKQNTSKLCLSFVSYNVYRNVHVRLTLYFPYN